MLLFFIFQSYTIVVHNARRPDGLGPPLLQGSEYGRVIRITMTFELAQLQRSLFLRYLLRRVRGRHERSAVLRRGIGYSALDSGLSMTTCISFM